MGACKSRGSQERRVADSLASRTNPSAGWGRPPTRLLLGYVVMVLGGIGLFFLIRSWGEGLTAPAVVEEPGLTGRGVTQGRALAQVLLALAAVLLVGRLLGWVFAHLGQPPVIGEVVAGIALGPSLLGAVAPDVLTYVLPDEVAPYLAVLAQLGIVLYMFRVGLELDGAQLRARA